MRFNKKLIFSLGIAVGLILGTAGLVRAATCTGPFFGGTGVCFPNEWFDGAIPFGSDVNGLATSTKLTFATSTNTLTAFSASTTNFSASANAWLTFITGSTQCLHVDTNGKVTGTGSDCSTGGGSSGNVATSTHEVSGQVATFSSNSATPATIAGNTNFTFVSPLLSVTQGSTSIFSVFKNAYFGATATSSFNSVGDLLVVGSTTLQNFTANNATTSQATTTNLSATTASTTNLIVSSAGGSGTACAQFSVNGTVSRTAAACNSGTVTSVGLSSSDSSLSISNTPITSSGNLGAVINTGHSNWWTALQNFTQASSSQVSATSSSYLATGGGFVTIGTSTPFVSFGGVNTHLLTVGDGSATTYISLNGSGSGTKGGVGLIFNNSTISTGGTYIAALGNPSAIFNTAYDNSFGIVAFNNLNSYTNDAKTPRQTIDTTGKTGISSSSPFALLSVHGLSIDNFSTLFAVASSSATATSTLFTINQQGAITLSAILPATSTAMTFNWATSPPLVEYQVGTAAFTITFINATTTLQYGSRKVIGLCNPSATAGAANLVGVEGTSSYTQTTTTNQCDYLGFMVVHATSSSAFKVMFTGAQTGFQ